MKSRKLRKLLGITAYIISDDGDKICIGSNICHDLISVNKKTLNLKCAIDPFHEGKKSLKSELLESAWDKLKELCESGEIQDIINGYDELDVKIPVFYYDYKNKEVVESHTDKLGWPNVTFDGILMYDNIFFTNKSDAVKHAIFYEQGMIGLYLERIEQLKNELKKVEDILNRSNEAMKKLKECDRVDREKIKLLGICKDIGCSMMSKECPGNPNCEILKKKAGEKK